MNLLKSFVHLLSSAFEHIVGDPVHTHAATAIKTSLQAAAKGGEDALLEIGNKVNELVNKGRAVTQEEWGELRDLAAKHLAAATEAPTPPPDPNAIQGTGAATQVPPSPASSGTVPVDATPAVPPPAAPSPATRTLSGGVMPPSEPAPDAIQGTG